MKFACERCKTRYSIADERVRGKVLKIRCKNCEFVISVREGMEEQVALAPAPATAERAARPTTMAPSSGPSEAPPAPPQQLEDEWYVSIDGQQSGPFILAEAQAWVSKHPFAADLHCWSEGFEDWLPVEKVSQLRGLRLEKKAAAPKGPPPRPGTAPVFAASAASAAARNTSEAAPGTASHAAPHVTAAAPQMIAAAPHVTAAAPHTIAAAPHTIAAAPQLAVPDSGPSEDPFAMLNALGRGVEPTTSSETTSTDSHDDDDDDLSIGEVSRVVNLADLMKQPRSRSGPAAAVASSGAAARIGSASRVGARTPAGGSAALANGSAPMALQPADAVTAGLALAAQAAQADALADVSAAGVPLAAQVAPPPKRGHLGVIIVVALTTIAVIVLVLVAAGVFSSDDQDGPRIAIDDYANLGGRKDPVFRPGSAAPVKPGSAADGAGKVVKPWNNPNHSGNGNNPNNSGTGNNPNNSGSGKVETVGVNGPVLELKADDVENMFQRNSDISRRCYEQALKKDPFLDVKKIAVTMSVDKVGMVNDVGLSSHADHQLGKCLTQRIKAWRFRPSTGGITTRINVVFGS
ncbi:MAG: zinc-ribbon domain-containing protein [Kofleriaceae bacterium]|nr:zinc-ribbon domain-containing protein [Kofleriaceae bacterium]